jgi:hypothetical protein
MSHGHLLTECNSILGMPVLFPLRHYGYRFCKLVHCRCHNMIVLQVGNEQAMKPRPKLLNVDNVFADVPSL